MKCSFVTVQIARPKRDTSPLADDNNLRWKHANNFSRKHVADALQVCNLLLVAETVV